MLSSVLLRGKGGKLQGKGDANRYGKVFSDRPPLLEVHAEVSFVFIEALLYITEHLLVTVGVGLSLRLDAFAAEREWRRCRQLEGWRANNTFPASTVFIKALRPPQ